MPAVPRPSPIRVPQQGEQVGRRAATPSAVRQPRAEAGEPVVGEDLVEERVVAAPIGVGPARLRHQGDDRHPAERHDPHHQRGRRQVPHSTQKRAHRCGDEVGQEESGDHEPGLHHLGLEGEADQCAGPKQRAQAAGLAGANGGIGSQYEQQDEQRVRDVAAVEKDHDRAPGQHQRGDRAGTHAGHPPTARYMTRTVSIPSITWGRTSAQTWNPKIRREMAWTQAAPGILSDRDRRPRVCRPVEEVVQAQRHAARRPAVEGLEVGLIEAPGVGQTRQGGDASEASGAPNEVGRRGSARSAAGGKGSTMVTLARPRRRQGGWCRRPPPSLPSRPNPRSRERCSGGASR